VLDRLARLVVLHLLDPVGRQYRHSLAL